VIVRRGSMGSSPIKVSIDTILISVTLVVTDSPWRCPNSFSEVGDSHTYKYIKNDGKPSPWLRIYKTLFMMPQKSKKTKSSDKKKSKKRQPKRNQVRFIRANSASLSKDRGNKVHAVLRSSSLPEEKGVIGVRLKNLIERKTVTEPDYDMASAFMSPNQVYTFKLQGYSTVSSNGSGIIAVSVPFDPSSGGFNFSEWTDLAALFDEVKLEGFRVQIVPFSNTTVTLTLAPLIIGTNLISSSAPGTEGAVAQLSDARYHPSMVTNSAGYSHSFRNHGIIGWSSTASVTDQPYAGCPGSFQMYVNNFSVSTLAFKVLVQGFYAFRARA